MITSPPLPSQPSAPQAALWHGLSLAARDARSGEATAFALALLGETASQGEMPVTLNKAIESLIIVGREDDARLLVAEVALVQGLQWPDLHIRVSVRTTLKLKPSWK